MELDNAAITRLASEWSMGSVEARDTLLPIIYDRLRQLARSQFNQAPDTPTLQPTALVNEAFMKLDQAGWQVENRRHFFALAARVMRQVLVDHARASGRRKRGGDQLRVTLSDEVATSEPPAVDVIQLDDSLNQLEEFNQRAALALELSYFGGFDNADVATQLDVSLRTIERELRFGRAWLKTRLQVT
ncbi:MAG: sigma-70 family RNA polymerase sigma factor [Wenzhouxiangella sp.]|nr:MAG: sigma-70 family RNA polymerase sigma factor [Wenzhouxiangella sp.]